MTQSHIDRTTETPCQLGPAPAVAAYDVAPDPDRGGDVEPAEGDAGSADVDEYEEL